MLTVELAQALLDKVKASGPLSEYQEAHFRRQFQRDCQHTWKTDKFGLVDDCITCGEGRA